MRTQLVVLIVLIMMTVSALAQTGQPASTPGPSSTDDRMVVPRGC